MCEKNKLIIENPNQNDNNLFFLFVNLCAIIDNIIIITNIISIISFAFFLLYILIN
jgi:hypothetical protein